MNVKNSRAILRQSALSIALSAAFSSAAFAGNIDFGVDGYTTSFDGPADQITVSGSNFAVGATAVNVEATPVDGIPAVTLPSSTNGGVTLVYTVTGVGGTNTETTTVTGSALLEENGNITGNSGSTTVDVTTFDEATLVTICSTVGGCGSDPTIDFGDVISTVYEISGTYDALAGTFTPGPGTTETTTTPGTGGNLVMSGSGSFGSSLNVDTNGATTNEEGTSTLSVEDGAVSLGVQNAGGSVNGFSADATSATIMGGTGTTTITVNNAGVQVNDSVNGTTFDLSNTGDLTIPGALTSATLNSTTGNITTLNSTTGNITTLNSTTGNIGGYQISGGQITHPDDIILNADAGPGGFGGVGAVVLQKANAQLARFDSNTSGGTVISTNTTIQGTTTLNGATTVNSSFNVDTNGAAANTTGTGLVSVTSGSASFGVQNASASLNGISVTSSTARVSSNSATYVSSSNYTEVYGANQVWVGSNASNLTLDSSGATFANGSGGPLTVTGVANGKSQFDAVNYGQLNRIDKSLSGGIASTIAMTNIPQVDESKTFAIGIGYGNYNGQHGYALGASFRPAALPNSVFKASVAGSSRGDTAFGVGAGMSW